MRQFYAWLVLFGALCPACAQQPSTLGWGERFQYYLQRTYGWQRMLLLVPDTAIDHLTDQPREWGRAPESFGYRYSSSFGSRVVRNSIEFAAGGLLHEDSRLRPSGETNFGARVRHALRQAFFVRGYRPAYSRIIATAGGMAVSSTWYPEASLSFSGFAEGVGFSYVDQIENSLLVEFSPDMKRWGRRMCNKLLRR